MARQDDECIRSGKGRRDEVGPTGIHPGSGPRPEGDLPVRTPGEINRSRPSGGAGVEQSDALRRAERLPRKADDADITE